MTRVKDKEPGVRLMGFGHRVYKNYDPRAAIVKKTADAVLDALGGNDELLDIAMGLEEIALVRRLLHLAQALPERRLLHRPDLQGDGLPDARCSRVLFALGRLPGWIAQWREMIDGPADQDRPPAAGLHGRHRARLRPASTRADRALGRCAA